jgi:L,D-peptidoglycan transpeptidase YkuD (ErfK/YbiS/YcfS/YnhG family)
MAILLALALLVRGDADGAPCAAHETAVVVRTSDHQLWLCEAGAAVARFRVALGVGGVGKRQQGDGKTPLGLYGLAAPRPSRSFGTFIEIGYPTAAQMRLGFTGSAVGIHGPPRGPLGPLAVHADWTAGCIALGSDAEVTAVARWVAQRRSRAVRIE